jgi:TrmH family RNA methyltransferase
MLVKSQLKYIQSLGQKKPRDENAVFIAEGPKIVGELLDESPGQVIEIYATPAWIQENSTRTTTASLTAVTKDDLARISQLITHHEVLAIVKKFIFPPAIEVRNSIILALDSIQDPGNMGTIIRIADWFGVSQVICGNGCADIYNPKVVQASMGSIGRVRTYYLDLAALLSTEENLHVYAATLEGQDVRKMDRINEGVIIIGNESKGIHPDIMQKVNRHITIPRKGRAESLNAAVATGIILSHIL